METKKYLVLNSAQEKELNAQGFVMVYSKGFAYNVSKDENGQILASVKCDYTDIITPSMR